METPVVHFLAGPEAARDEERIHCGAVRERVVRLLTRASELFAGAAKGGRGDVYHLAQWAWTHLARGRLDKARDCLEEIQGVAAGGTGDFQFLLWSGMLWTELLCRTGRPAEAVELLFPRVERSREQHFRVAWGESWLALALLLTGRLEEAEAVAVSSTEKSRREKEAAVLLDAARVLAMVRTAQRDWEAADAAFAESLDLCLKAPYPWGAAWTRLEWARSLAERGEPDRAAEMEAEARVGFDAIGAQPNGLPCPYPVAS